MPDVISAAKRWKVLAICYAVIAVEGYDISVVGTTAPQFARELQFTPENLSLVFSASMVGMLLGALSLGRGGDRFGRRPVLIGSLAGMAVLTLATVLATSFPAFLLLRFAIGLALGGAMPTLIAVASDVSSARSRTTTVSFLFSGIPIGGIICALATYATFASGGWRAAFAIGGVLPLLLALVCIAMPETRALAIAGAPASRSFKQALFAENRTVTTVSLWVMAASTLVVFYLLLNWLPSFVVMKGFPPRNAATAILVFNLGNLVGAALVGITVAAAGFRWTMICVYAALAVSLGLLGFASEFSGFLILCAAAGLFMNAAQSAIYGVTPRYFPADVRATGAGSVVAAARTGSILGPLYAGFLFAAKLTVSDVLLLSIPVLGLAVVTVLVLAWRSTEVGAHSDYVPTPANS